MAVVLYRSSDGSAPVLDGQVGSLVAALDAILVNGYGAKAAAGWTKPFAGTNTATYRQGTGSNQYYLHVNDNGPGAGGAKEARFFGSETASAVLTGTNLFPTAAQAANGSFIRKSVAADATTRVWVAIADQRTLYMGISTGDLASAYVWFMFGEFYSFKAGDLGRTMLIGRAAENSGSAANETFDIITKLATNLTMHYLARDAQNNVGAVACGKLGDQSFYTAPGGPNNFFGDVAYTNPADNDIYLAPMRVTETVGGNGFRGRMRGLYHFGHPIASVADGDTFSGVLDLAGKTFVVIKQTANAGVVILETSNTWESN